MAGVLQRVAGWLVPSLKSTPEGAWHPGPYNIIGKGILPAAWGQYLNFWQMDLDPLPYGGTSAMVEACVSAYAQTIAMCAMNHKRERPGGGTERVTTSALSRVMRQPNDYQTTSDFLLNLVRSLYLTGNGYALALRNDRFEVSSLHLMHPRESGAEVVEGEIFYGLGGNSVIESRLHSLGADTLAAVPQRDVLHVRLHCPRDYLRGETPLTAAALSVCASNAAAQSTIAFFQNQSRPSGVIETDLQLTKPQTDELRARWNEQAQGLAQGGTPILSWGLKWKPVTMSAQDAQLADTLKMSDEQIAEVFRVPLALIGGQSQQPTGSTEALMNFWISNGLGFALNQVELAFDRLFGLSKIDGEYSELDTSILLRSAFRERIEGLARGVQGGIYSPDEARALEGLAPAPEGAGKEPRVQQQVVPLSFAEQLLEAQTRPPPAPAPAPEPQDDKPADDEGKHAPAMTRDEWRAWISGRAA